MTITIVTNGELGILEVKYSPAPVTEYSLAEQRKLVADAISQSNISKVFLDASSLTSFPSILTSLHHNEGIVADDTLRRARFAVLCSSLGQYERDLETTGVNRGVRVKCVTSRAEGLVWLG